jgi:hypothetical protein
MQPSPPNYKISTYTPDFAKRLKKALLSVTALLLIIFSILIYITYIRPYHQIDALHAKYLTITRPTTYAQVLQTMGPNPTRDQPDQGSAHWDDDYISEEESQKITHILQYSVSTFFLPVTFEFTFDKDNNLIGKHRYD